MSMTDLEISHYKKKASFFNYLSSFIYLSLIVSNVFLVLIASAIVYGLFYNKGHIIESHFFVSCAVLMVAYSFLAPILLCRSLINMQAHPASGKTSIGKRTTSDNIVV